MAGKSKRMNVASSRTLWVVAAVFLLIGSVSIALDSYDVTDYQDNLTVDSMATPYGEMPDGCLIANLSAEIGGVVEVAGGYTLNLLSGSVVHYLYAQPDSIINIQGGTIDEYGILANGGCTINVTGTYVGHTPDEGMNYDYTANALVFDGDDSWIGYLTFTFEGADVESVIPFSTGAVINFVTADESDPTLVEMDIKPGSYPNSINIDSRGVVPVALLSNGFNVAEIDPTLIRFAGASPVHWALEDVDGDGNMDMILHFRTQTLVGLDENSTEAMLWTTEDSPIQIRCSDTVKILKSNRKK